MAKITDINQIKKVRNVFTGNEGEIIKIEKDRILVDFGREGQYGREVPIWCLPNTLYV